MRRYRLAPQFLRDLRALEPGMSPGDEETLDALLAAVVTTPESLARVQSFYDPTHPSWLVRADPFIIHYVFDAITEEVLFLDVFRRR